MNSEKTAATVELPPAKLTMDSGSGRSNDWLARNWQAAAGLALLSLLWGYNWVQMKIAVFYAAPIDFAALRTVLGAVVLFAYMAWRRVPLQPIRLRATILLGLLQTTGFFGLSMWALEAGAAGRTAILVYTMPFWVLLMSWPLLRDRPTAWQWIASGFALAGLIMILQPWTAELGTRLSVILATLAGLSWGLSVIVAKKMKMKGQELLRVTAWQMVIGALPFVLLALFAPTKPIHWTSDFVFALFYNILPGNVIAWLLWMFVLGRLPAAVAGMGLLGAPLIGLSGAWIQLGETPLPEEGWGVALVASGLGLLTLAGLRRSNNL